MAVRLTHVCDACPDEHEGQQQQITIGDLTGLLDLCEMREKELVEPLRQLLLEAGRTEDGKAVKPGRRVVAPSEQVACIVDGCTNGPFVNRNSMLAHLRTNHNTTAAELEGRADHVCPLKSCGRAFGSPQALAVHRARKHPGRRR